MSKIKKIVQSRLSELAFIEMQKEDEGLIVDKTLTSISLRVSKDLLKQIDIIANKLELSRSDVIRSFLSASAAEAFQELNMSIEEVFEHMEYLEEDDRKNALAEKVAELEAKDNE